MYFYVQSKNRFVHICFLFNLLRSILFTEAVSGLILFRQRQPLNQNKLQSEGFKRGTVLKSMWNKTEPAWGIVWQNRWWSVDWFCLSNFSSHFVCTILSLKPHSTHRNAEAIITHHCEEDLDFKKLEGTESWKTHTNQLTGCHTATYFTAGL